MYRNETTNLNFKYISKAHHSPYHLRYSLAPKLLFTRPENPMPQQMGDSSVKLNFRFLHNTWLFNIHAVFSHVVFAIIGIHNIGLCIYCDFYNHREVAEAFNPGNWGWGRRRRSLPLIAQSSLNAEKTIAEKRAVITVSRAQANDLLSYSKRGDLCLRWVLFLLRVVLPNFLFLLFSSPIIIPDGTRVSLNMKDSILCFINPVFQF